MKPIIGIALGDPAGIGPEITAKALHHGFADYTPVLFGNYRLFAQSLEKELPITVVSDYERAAIGEGITFVDMPAGDDIRMGQITADAGRLMAESLLKAVEYHKAGKIDGLVMAPITKQALHEAGYTYTSEFELFADAYHTSSVRAVIRCENIFRATVVGHCAFREIPNRLNTQGVVDTAHALLQVIRTFKGDGSIAIAALNPHAGENGLFGDEETTILQPAIDRLRAEGVKVDGPCPADTVFLRAVNGINDGVVFLYHDQGNIAMKSRFFGDGVLIYSNVPDCICSVGHGSALDIAGKGVADPANIISCIASAVEICKRGAKDE